MRSATPEIYQPRPLANACNTRRRCCGRQPARHVEKARPRRCHSFRVVCKLPEPETAAFSSSAACAPMQTRHAIQTRFTVENAEGPQALRVGPADHQSSRVRMNPPTTSGVVSRPPLPPAFIRRAAAMPSMAPLICFRRRRLLYFRRWSEFGPGGLRGACSLGVLAAKPDGTIHSSGRS